MDYRSRKYYNIKMHYYVMELDILKAMVPSLKVNRPYNHYTKNVIDNYGMSNILPDEHYRIHDSRICGKDIQLMISCRNEDSQTLETVFKTLSFVIGGNRTLKEITKEECGQ